MSISLLPPWQTDEPLKKSFSHLDKNIECDVCIVGGGIHGVTAAYILSKQIGRGRLANGELLKKVILLEKETIGSGETNYTTAFISYVIDADIQDLIKKFGEEKTQLVKQSCQRAISFIEETLKEEKIDCEFMRVPLIVYATKEEHREHLKKEGELGKKLGLNVSFKTNEALKFKNKGYMEACCHAKFNPMRYLKGILNKAVENGVEVYEKTQALEVAGNEQLTIKTDKGYEIKAKYMIAATHAPFNSTLLMQSKLTPWNTYVFSGKVASDTIPEGLFIDTEDPYHYLRIDKKDGYDQLILGGGDHITDEIKRNGEGRISTVNTAIETNDVELITLPGDNIEPYDNTPDPEPEAPTPQTTPIATGVISPTTIVSLYPSSLPSTIPTITIRPTATRTPTPIPTRTPTPRLSATPTHTPTPTPIASPTPAYTECNDSSVGQLANSNKLHANFVMYNNIGVPWSSATRLEMRYIGNNPQAFSPLLNATPSLDPTRRFVTFSFDVTPQQSTQVDWRWRLFINGQPSGDQCPLSARTVSMTYIPPTPTITLTPTSTPIPPTRTPTPLPFTAPLSGTFYLSSPMAADVYIRVDACRPGTNSCAYFTTGHSYANATHFDYLFTSLALGQWDIKVDTHVFTNQQTGVLAPGFVTIRHFNCNTDINSGITIASNICRWNVRLPNNVLSFNVTYTAPTPTPIGYCQPTEGTGCSCYNADINNNCKVDLFDLVKATSDQERNCISYFYGQSCPSSVVTPTGYPAPANKQTVSTQNQSSSLLQKFWNFMTGK